MTKRSRDCCKSTLVSCMTSEIFGLAMRGISPKCHREKCIQVDSHFAKNSSTTSAVSSNTLSKVPLTSFATLLISGA